jgi:hypothetical protein
MGEMMRIIAGLRRQRPGKKVGMPEIRMALLSVFHNIGGSVVNEPAQELIR